MRNNYNSLGYEIKFCHDIYYYNRVSTRPGKMCHAIAYYKVDQK